MSLSMSTPVTSNETTPTQLKQAYLISPAVTRSDYSPTIQAGSHQQKLNIVTRVAIEGRAKHGQDGASIRMYLKMCLPLDFVCPGMTVPLFQEENVKILSSQVHPLDNQSAPYNFSSTFSPLLHHAARALNLPARSSEVFDGVFDLPSSSSCSNGARESPPLSGENIHPVDNHYTGHILVSGYHISYVLPKLFLSRKKNAQGKRVEGSLRSPSESRRLSINERNTAQYLAAVDMWVPYVSRPPRSPYLLSIPTPRCLHNHIKLRIFPPTTSSSLASLESAEEEGGSWDLTSEPHVTRSIFSYPRRLNSYTPFVDDESSDSSTAGSAEGCEIEGTFPSAERVRVRWARSSNVCIPGNVTDGRRKVGVQEVEGELICVVRGKSGAPKQKGAEGVVVDLKYKGTCKGVWFPGVATLLGMDVSLESRGLELYWLEGSSPKWEIVGGTGYTGYEVGRNMSPFWLNPLPSNVSPASIPPTIEDLCPAQVINVNNDSSTASLIHAPLPEQNVPDYSFETAGTNFDASVTSNLDTISTASSSIQSLSKAFAISTPTMPITLHLNINDLVPPAKNTFTFTISGTVLVVANHMQCPRDFPLCNPNRDTTPILLPRFTVMAADSESITTIVRNEINCGLTNVEVYNYAGDIYQDAQFRKIVLQKGGFTKCTEDGTRILLKSINAHPQNLPAAVKRDVSSIISSVTVSVMPLMTKDFSAGGTYIVCLCLNVSMASDWLEFGLARATSQEFPSRMETVKNSKVTVTDVSLQGVPIKHENISLLSHGAGFPLSFEKMDSLECQEWTTLIRVHMESFTGGTLIFEYLVEEDGFETQKVKDDNSSLFKVLLPTFPVPVKKFELRIDGSTEMIVDTVHSNFSYQQSMNNGCKYLLMSFENSGFFHPQLSFKVLWQPTATLGKRHLGMQTMLFVICVFLVLNFTIMRRFSNRIEQLEGRIRDYFVSGQEIDNACSMISSAVVLNVEGNFTQSQEDVNQMTTATTTYNDLSHSQVSFTFLPATESDFLSGSLPSISMPTGSSSTITTELNSFLPLEPLFSLDWHTTFDKVVEKANVMWQIMRKMYHYPLDPP